MHIILASKSPRRRELMSLITDDFEVRTKDVDERAIEEELQGEGASKVSLYIAKAKAEAVFMSLTEKEREEYITVAADTSVISEGKILGKPADKEDARSTLYSLSGKRHSVVTGVWIMKGNVSKGFCEETFVEFCDLDEFQKKTIEAYVNSDDPYDKAGSYGIQNGGALLVKKVDGDYFNVVGLPVMSLARELEMLP
jgi:septum formation protein